MQDYILAGLVFLFFVVFLFKTRSLYSPEPSPTLPTGASACFQKIAPFTGLQTFGTQDCSNMTHGTYSKAYPSPDGKYYCCN